MDMVDFTEWFIYGLLAVAAVMSVLVVITLLIAAINEARYQIRRRLLRTSTAPSLSIEEVLERNPGVAYEELPAGDGDGGDDRASCVICVSPYEAGEACSVLPACRHLFHKACVARWLRVRCTCPLCRDAVALPRPRPRGPREGNHLNAAETMV